MKVYILQSSTRCWSLLPESWLYLGKQGEWTTRDKAIVLDESHPLSAILDTPESYYLKIEIVEM